MLRMTYRNHELVWNGLEDIASIDGRDDESNVFKVSQSFRMSYSIV